MKLGEKPAARHSNILGAQRAKYARNFIGHRDTTSQPEDDAPMGRRDAGDGPGQAGIPPLSAPAPANPPKRRVVVHPGGRPSSGTDDMGGMGADTGDNDSDDAGGGDDDGDGD